MSFSLSSSMHIIHFPLSFLNSTFLLFPLSGTHPCFHQTHPHAPHTPSGPTTSLSHTHTHTASSVPQPHNAIFKLSYFYTPTNPIITLSPINSLFSEQQSPHMELYGQNPLPLDKFCLRYLFHPRIPTLTLIIPAIPLLHSDFFSHSNLYSSIFHIPYLFISTLD